VLTKQVSRTDFLLSKMAAGMLLYTFAYVVSLAACLYYAMVIFPDATYAGLPLALMAMWVQGLFFAVFAVFVSTVAPSPTVAATLGFAGYAVLSIPTIFPRAVKFIPTGLTTLANGLLVGTARAGDVAFALAATAVLSLLLAGGAVFIFKRQEL
jgi:ABC-type transport system involved in multi-copper enzyme maturation permease subunit